MIKEIKQVEEELDETEKKRAMVAEALAANAKSSGEMDYLAWSRCIDELENQIIASKQTVQINEEFLKAAIMAREKCDKPKD